MMKLLAKGFCVLKKVFIFIDGENLGYSFMCMKLLKEIIGLNLLNNQKMSWYQWNANFVYTFQMMTKNGYWSVEFRSLLGRLTTITFSN